MLHLQAQIIDSDRALFHFLNVFYLNWQSYTAINARAPVTNLNQTRALISPLSNPGLLFPCLWGTNGAGGAVSVFISRISL